MASWRYNSSGKLNSYSLSQTDMDKRNKAQGVFLIPIVFVGYILYHRLIAHGYLPLHATLYVGIPCGTLLLAIIHVPIVRFFYNITVLIVIAWMFYDYNNKNHAVVHTNYNVSIQPSENRNW